MDAVRFVPGVARQLFVSVTRADPGCKSRRYRTTDDSNPAMGQLMMTCMRLKGLDGQIIWPLFGFATKRNLLQQTATGSRVEVNLRAKKAIKPLKASGLTC